MPICFSLQTSLCSTAIDNPNHLTKEDIVNHILNFLPTDTILFQLKVSNQKDIPLVEPL